MTELSLSIIVPCYNAANYIPRCLDSLVNQVIDSYEILCIDDASTDNTYDLLQEYALQYPQIRVIRHEFNKRQGGARNTGIRNAKGYYIGFVDIDDSVTSHMYSSLYNEAVKYNLDIVESDYTIINMDGSTRSVYLFKNEIHNRIEENVRKKLIVNGGSVWGKLYKKEFLLSNNLFFPEGLFYEDNYFVPMVYLKMKTYSYIRQCNYNYYINPSSTTNKKNTDNLYDRFVIADMLQDSFAKMENTHSFKEELEFLVILNAYSGVIFASMLNYTYINYELLNRAKNYILNYSFKFEDNKWYIQLFSKTDQFLMKVARFNVSAFVVYYKIVALLRSLLRKIR